MSRRYDILAIDLDGTLLSSTGEVSERNARSVRMAQEAGMEVVIATGRSPTESREALEALQHEGFVIAAGGSLLCDARTGRTIQRQVLPAAIVNEITHWLLEHNHPALILKDAHATGYDYLVVGDGDLDPASQWWFRRLNVATRHVLEADHDPHPHDTLRAGAVASETRLAPLAHQLRKVFAHCCAMQHWSAVTSTHAIGSPTHLLEIFSINVSKWTMLATYCNTRGIPASRVAAIGDGLNDVDLVANAGLGIAMANAVPQVKSVARAHADHHDADGVATAIEHLLAGDW